ncbi:hypothetical protein [Neobacillus notoginsengisoli]|uniref:hypothetical protein n=1 Tax=Neobacillus notoginsengisoli TaxID=1578198 RepID=UPI00131415C4|nr:hypothetical protein [Neobacillus notoginsengisoli]
MGQVEAFILVLYPNLGQLGTVDGHLGEALSQHEQSWDKLKLKSSSSVPTLGSLGQLTAI